MHYEISSLSLNTKFLDPLRMDPDIFLFKAVCGVVLVSIVWPLAFLGYLVTLYGLRILAWQ
jgi:hypothetical protein